MRGLTVYRNQEPAGILKEEDNRSYSFIYDDGYFSDPAKPAISLTLPKSKKLFNSDYFFPFFFNMLSEGVNRKLQCRAFKIDEEDHFGLLSATAGFDSFGAITVKPLTI